MPMNKHTGLGLSKFLVLALQVGLILNLYGCSPPFDWRTVRVEQQAYTALFPAKPQHLERQLSYKEDTLKQALEVAKVADQIYSITTIQVPPAIAGSADELMKQLQQAIFTQANIDPASVLAVNGFYLTSGSPMRLPTADYFLLMKPVDGVERMMRVRWIMRTIPGLGLYIYQLSLLKPVPKNSRPLSQAELQANLSDDNNSLFFTDFHPD